MVLVSASSEFGNLHTMQALENSSLLFSLFPFLLPSRPSPFLVGSPRPVEKVSTIVSQASAPAFLPLRLSSFLYSLSLFAL